MASILIKDTTREQREQIVRESLGDDYDVGCGYESTGIDYSLYIEGKKELRELIAQTESAMRKAAADLDFEKAAMLRDELFELKSMK